MDDARVFGEGGAPHGTVLRALEQTKARGRFRDRSWFNEKGKALQFTIVLEAERVKTRALPLSCGIALLKSFESLPGGSGAGFSVKWPNDVMAGGKKVSGILCEASGGKYYAGIGVNCDGEGFPERIASKAASLETVLGAGIDMDGLLSSILKELATILPEPFDSGFLSGKLYGTGRAVRFIEGMPEKGDVLEGRIERIGQGGELILRLPSGDERSCSSGEILW
jgi:BirA family transcriptional regulator, biotin operon repressor / biotin---[acetyl-CoA-carboxylase] ligase